MTKKCERNEKLSVQEGAGMTTTTIECAEPGQTCQYDVLDRGERAQTLRCPACGRCAVSIGITGLPREVLIRLTQFHVRRGDGDDQRPLHDRSLANRMYWRVSVGVALSPAMAADFGIVSERHYEAVQCAIRCGVSSYAFDRLLGDGPALTLLMQSLPNSPCDGLEFTTPWDEPHALVYSR